MADKKFSEFTQKTAFGSTDRLAGYDGSIVDDDSSNFTIPADVVAKEEDLVSHVDDSSIHVTSSQKAALNGNATLGPGNTVAGQDDIVDAYSKTEQDATDNAQDTQINAKVASVAAGIGVTVTGSATNVVVNADPVNDTDEKVAVSGVDTVAGFLVDSVVSGNNSITFNPVDVGGGNLRLDLRSVAYSWGDHRTAGYLTGVVDDTAPELGGNLLIPGSVPYRIHWFDASNAFTGSMGWSETYGGMGWGFGTTSGFDENNGGILVGAGKVHFYGSQVKVNTLSHSDPIGFRDVRCTETGIVYSSPSPAVSWHQEDTSNGTTTLTDLDTWVAIPGLAITLTQDVDIADVLELTVNAYVENITNSDGTIVYAFGVDGAQPGAAGSGPKLIAAAFEGLVPASWTLVSHGGLITGQVLAVWAKKASESSGQFQPVLNGSVVDHEVVVAVSGAVSGVPNVNLDTTVTAESLIVTNTAGSNAVLPGATTNAAGVLSAADKVKIDNIAPSTGEANTGNSIGGGIVDIYKGMNLTVLEIRSLGNTAEIEWTLNGDVIEGSIAGNVFDAFGSAATVQVNLDSHSGGLNGTTSHVGSADRSAWDAAQANPVQVSAGEITAGTEVALRSWSPADVVAVAEAHGIGGGGTGLGLGTVDGVSIEISSSTGDNVVIPAATGVNAGLFSAADKSTLDGRGTGFGLDVAASGDAGVDELVKGDDSRLSGGGGWADGSTVEHNINGGQTVSSGDVTHTAGQQVLITFSTTGALNFVATLPTGSDSKDFDCIFLPSNGAILTGLNVNGSAPGFASTTPTFVDGSAYRLSVKVTATSSYVEFGGEMT